jgi:hypothetical protein
MRSFLARLALALSLTSAAWANLTPAGRFLGTVPGFGDIYIESFSRVAANAYFFDFRNGLVEYATVPLTDGVGAANSELNFRVTLALGEQSATGSWGGLAFTALRQSPLNGLRTAVYTGASAQPASLTVAQTKLTILSDSRVVLTALSQGRLIVGGVGRLANKIVTIPLTSGVTAVFAFDPVAGVVFGKAALIGSTPVEFVLVEAQRPALVNIATRGTVGEGSQLIAGFVCTNGAKTFLIRAVGPTLGALGVVGAQADPRLTLYAGQTALATNDDWGSATLSPQIATAGAQAGAFQMVGGSRDAALVVRLESGPYTVVVDGKAAKGDALVEVYEIE